MKATDLEFDGEIEWEGEDEDGGTHCCSMNVSIKVSVDVTHIEEDYEIGDVRFISVEEVTDKGNTQIDSDLLDTIKDVFVDEYLNDTLSDKFCVEGW
jgi:hypothetical protein